MKGLSERIRAVVETPSEEELAALRAALKAVSYAPTPTDPRAAAIHNLVREAFEEARSLFGRALEALPDQQTARGYLELAEKALLQAEELTVQARALAARPIDFGTG